MIACRILPTGVSNLHEVDVFWPVLDCDATGVTMTISMKRTTSGLLQGKQSDVTERHLRAAVHFLEARVKDEDVRLALRLDRARTIVRESETGHLSSVRNLKRVR